VGLVADQPVGRRAVLLGLASQEAEGSSECQSFPLNFRIGQHYCFDHLWLADILHLRVMGTDGGSPMDGLQQLSSANAATGKPLHLCPNCSAYIIAAIWSGSVSERCVRNVWSCEACGFEFETAAYLPVGAPLNH
jgi:ribosomal protein L37AE/L43A